MSRLDLDNFGSLRKTALVFVFVLSIVLFLGVGAATQLDIIEVPNLLNEDEELSTLRAVPSDANLILRYDVEQVESSNVTRSLYGDEFSHAEFISTVTKSTSNLSDKERNLSNLGEVIVFGTVNLNSYITQNQYYGTLIETSENPKSVAEIAVGSTNYTSSEYKGHRILNLNNSNASVGVVSKGKFYVIGKDEVVKDVIDTARGQKDSVDIDKIPSTDGETYANMAVYNFSGILGSISTDGSNRIPQKIFLSQSTVGDKIRTQIDMKYAEPLEEKPNSTGLPSSYRDQYKSNFTADTTREGISISYTTSPQFSNRDLTNLATPNIGYSVENYG
jgi:hypothetical protein